jgi:hypothetical protein
MSTTSLGIEWDREGRPRPRSRLSSVFHHITHSSANVSTAYSVPSLSYSAPRERDRTYEPDVDELLTSLKTRLMNHPREPVPREYVSKILRIIEVTEKAFNEKDKAIKDKEKAEEEKFELQEQLNKLRRTLEEAEQATSVRTVRQENRGRRGYREERRDSYSSAGPSSTPIRDNRGGAIRSVPQERNRHADGRRQWYLDEESQILSRPGHCIRAEFADQDLSGSDYSESNGDLLPDEEPFQEAERPRPAISDGTPGVPRVVLQDENSHMQRVDESLDDTGARRMPERHRHRRNFSFVPGDDTGLPVSENPQTQCALQSSTNVAQVSELSGNSRGNAVPYPRKNDIHSDSGTLCTTSDMWQRTNPNNKAQTAIRQVSCQDSGSKIPRPSSKSRDDLARPEHDMSAGSTPEKNGKQRVTTAGPEDIPGPEQAVPERMRSAVIAKRESEDFAAIAARASVQRQTSGSKGQ